jgi:prepilin-type N-terminal cleavage/methylation domain-containing protein
VREFLSNKRFKQSGFTLIEVVVVMGIFVILASFATINLLRPQRSADLNSTTTSIIADIKQQQARSMLGEASGGSSAVVHSIYFENNRYTLFVGAIYNVADPANFVVNLSPGLTLTNTFPSSQVTFNLQSGEITGFIDGSNSVTLTATGGQVKTLTLNKYGVVSVN